MDVLKSFLDRLASFDLWAIATVIYAVGVKVCGNNFWPAPKCSQAHHKHTTSTPQGLRKEIVCPVRTS